MTPPLSDMPCPDQWVLDRASDLLGIHTASLDRSDSKFPFQPAGFRIVCQWVIENEKRPVDPDVLRMRRAIAAFFAFGGNQQGWVGGCLDGSHDERILAALAAEKGE